MLTSFETTELPFIGDFGWSCLTYFPTSWILMTKNSCVFSIVFMCPQKICYTNNVSFFFYLLKNLYKILQHNKNVHKILHTQSFHLNRDSTSRISFVSFSLKVSRNQIFHLKLNRKCATSSLRSIQIKVCINVEIDRFIMEVSYITI